MEPYLSSYLTLSAKGLEAMLAMRAIVMKTHRDPSVATARIQAMETALREARANELRDHQHAIREEQERSKKRRLWVNPKK